MAGFHQDGAAFNAEGFVRAHVGTAKPATCWISTMLVFKYAIHDKYFFASKMPMRV
jgi:hypothetical protein